MNHRELLDSILRHYKHAPNSPMMHYLKLIQDDGGSSSKYRGYCIKIVSSSCSVSPILVCAAVFIFNAY